MNRNHTVASASGCLSVCFEVRSLEQQNKLLEAEIEAYQNRFEKPTGLRLLYEEQLRELKKIAEQMRVQRVRKNYPDIFCSSTFQTYRACSSHLTAPWKIQLSNYTRCQLGLFEVLYLVTGLFLSGKWRGTSVCLSVMEYNCHHTDEWH